MNEQEQLKLLLQETPWKPAAPEVTSTGSAGVTRFKVARRVAIGVSNLKLGFETPEAAQEWLDKEVAAGELDPEGLGVFPYAEEE